MGIAGIDVMQSALACQLPSMDQGFHRRCGNIEQPIVRMKRRKVQRHIGPELLSHPLTQRADLGIGVIEPRDQQGRQFEPDRGMPVHIAERLQHGLQVTATHLVVEGFAERLEIDVRRIHPGEELYRRLRIDVAGGHGNGLQANRMAGGGHIQRILQKDHRIVVGERHTATAVAQGGLGNLFGRGLGAQGIHLT